MYNFLAKFICFSICLVSLTQTAIAQRIADHNTIGWYSSYNTINISKNISIWLEYSWRRHEVINNWQQSLARGGVQYNFQNGITASLLYGRITTYPYGDYPAGPHSIPENRLTEQVSWGERKGLLNFSHRFRLEQRWMGRIDQKATDREVSGWNYLNRLRYMGRVAVPLNRKTIENKTLYAALFDEVFVGFGKNVRQNVFDQNRVCLTLGYQFNSMFRLEAGYLN